MHAACPIDDRRRSNSGGLGRGLKASLSLILLATLTLGCGGPRPSSGDRGQPSEAPTAQQRALNQCQRLRDQLLAGLRELRQAELNLARLRSAPLSPAPGRPIWDEEKERRYSQEDQEIDRQHYLRDLAAWREQEQARWAAWQQRQTPEIMAAQQRLNQLSLQLHRRYPVLFTGPTSIEVRPGELARLSRCEGSVESGSATGR